MRKKKREKVIYKVKLNSNGNKALIKKRQEAALSPGEQKIALFLTQNNIRFIGEWHHPRLFNRHTRCLLFLDFYLPKQRCAIEFDGQHHYYPIHGNDKLISQQQKDRIKNIFCKNNKIKLLRIPYWKFNEVELMICQFFDKHF